MPLAFCPLYLLLPSMYFSFSLTLFLILQLAPLFTCILTHECQTLNDLMVLCAPLIHSYYTVCHLQFCYEHTYGVLLLKLTLQKGPHDLSAISICLHLHPEHTYGILLPQFTLQRRLCDLSAISIRQYEHI